MNVHSRAPNSPDLSYGIGQMLSMQGRDGEAIAYLEKATQSPDNAVRAYRDLAESYSRSGDSERALDAYNKAISSQEKEIAEKTARGMPISFAEERLNYTKMDKARELMRTNNFEEAQAIINEVSEAMPGDDSVAALQDQLTRKRQG
jgi:predicted Zn-dependent protease